MIAVGHESIFSTAYFFFRFQVEPRGDFVRITYILLIIMYLIYNT